MATRRLRARGRRAGQRDTRGLLLDATAALLSERSNLDVSLSDIAKRSGLNSALIKYYFGNKDGLFLALLERVADKAMGELQSLVDMPISADQKLRIHISGIINTYFRSPYVNHLIKHMIVASTPEAADRVAEIFVKPMIDVYHKIIAQGITEQRFRPIEPGMLYYSLVGACEHIFYASYSLPRTFGVGELSEELKQRYLEHVVDISMNGILVARAR